MPGIQKFQTGKILAICFLLIGIVSLVDGEYFLMLIRFVIAATFFVQDRQHGGLKR